MLKDVIPGKYRAKALEGVWAQVGAKKTSAVGVLFEFEAEAGKPKEQVWWVGYITPTMCTDGVTVAQHTFDNLVKLGYREDLALEKDKDGNPKFGKNHLADKEVEIVIELQPGQKDPKKMYHTVRYINEISGARLTGVAVEQVLAGMSLKAELAAARARLGAPQPKPAAQTAPAAQQGTPPFGDEADVPF